MSEPYLITTAISYPNGPPHIGHAYEAIAGDAIARFQRSQGKDVRFVGGTDEHGLKMVQTARSQGRETIDLADEMFGYFRKMVELFGLSYDAFVRTTEPHPHKASIALSHAMKQPEDMYLASHEGWY